MQISILKQQAMISFPVLEIIMQKKIKIAILIIYR